MKKRTTASTLNLRSKPTSESSVSAKLPQGTIVEVQDVSGWSLVRTPLGEGWVSSQYLEDAPVSPSWRVANSLEALLSQINARAPKRSKKFDGSIGDDAHSERASDHNVNKDGVVLARDYTHDPANGADMGKVTESIRLSRDKRVAYVIHNGRIFSSTVQPWKWRAYTGADKHLHHAHVSVVRDPVLYDNPGPWAV